VRRLRQYLLATTLFTALGVGTLYAILRGAHLVIRQCRSWFGRHGQSRKLDPAEFGRRRDEVIAAYAPLPAGEVTLCLDVKRVYHRPEKGACWQHEQVPGDRPARYHKSDTRTDILGALAPREAKLALECTPSATGAATAQFLARVVQGLVAAGSRLIHLVLDNASVNTAALKEAVLQPWRGYLRVHWTPPHASWLNLIEPFWSGFQRAVLQNSWFVHHDQVVTVTTAYLEYWRAHPREYRWPKRQRQRRQPARLPLWRRLDAIPINS
jgi:DDE superfamily endonuclease